MFGKQPFSSASFAGSSNNVYQQLLSILSSSAITITKVLTYLKTLSIVISTSVVSIQRFISKIMTKVVETTLVVLSDIALHLVALAKAVTGTPFLFKSITQTYSISVTGAVSLIRKVGKIFSILSTSVVSIARSQLKTLTRTVTATVSILKLNIFARVLSVVSTSTATIRRLFGKTLFVLSTSTSSIIRRINKIFSVISTTLSSIIVVLFPRLGSVERFTFVVDIRDRAVKLFKSRNVFANKKKSNIQR